MCVKLYPPRIRASRPLRPDAADAGRCDEAGVDDEDRASELAAEAHDEPRPEEPDDERAEDSLSSRITPRPASRERHRLQNEVCQGQNGLSYMHSTCPSHAAPS